MSAKRAQVGLWLVLCGTLVVVCGFFLVAYRTHVERPSAPVAATTALIITPPHEPTYVVYGRALYATAQAIVWSLPTPSPLPNTRPDLQIEEQRRYLWRIALPTARALFPPPPNFDPNSEITRVPRLTPIPTEPPYPSTPTTNGAIYNLSLEDNPEGKMLGEVNYWVGQIGGLQAYVFAGHAKERPSQGIIIIETPIIGTVGVNDPTRRFDYYPTPAQVGALRILDEVGGRLTLQAADNSLLYFDLGTRQWVNP